MAKGAYIGINNTARKVKSGYIGIEDVARKIKKAYIGVPTEFPVYEERTVAIDENNVTEYFDVENASYGFEGANGVFSSSATSGTSSSRISESTWVSKKDIKDFSFSYVVGNRSASTLANLVIAVGGKDVVKSTTIGEKGNWSGAIKEGEAIEFYSRNASTPSTISNITATAQTQTGTEVKSVAKLCWESLNPVYTERMVVYEETNTLNFADLPFEPKYFALETLGTIPSASTIYVASIYADKESGLMRIVYKASSQSGFLQYKETYNGDGSIKVEWGKNSFYAYLVSYKLFSHSTNGIPYRVTIWG